MVRTMTKATIKMDGSRPSVAGKLSEEQREELLGMARELNEALGGLGDTDVSTLKNAHQITFFGESDGTLVARVRYVPEVQAPEPTSEEASAVRKAAIAAAIAAARRKAGQEVAVNQHGDPPGTETRDITLAGWFYETEEEAGRMLRHTVRRGEAEWQNVARLLRAIKAPNVNGWGFAIPGDQAIVSVENGRVLARKLKLECPAYYKGGNFSQPVNRQTKAVPPQGYDIGAYEPTQEGDE
jgi:hypothetical protein